MPIVNVAGLKDDEGKLFEVVPAGKYEMQIISVDEGETGPTSKNPGAPMLKVKCRIIDGEHAERVLFTNIMIPTANMDENAIKLNRARLKRLCMACGLNITTDGLDTQDLIGATFMGVVGVRKDKNDPNKEFNDINDYLAK